MRTARTETKPPKPKPKSRDALLRQIAAVAKRKGGFPCTITPEDLRAK